MNGSSYIPGWANIPSTSNTFTTGLTSHTGSYENNPQPWALIRTYSSDQDGTLTVVIRNPNVATDITTFTRSITAGTSDFFPFLKGDAEIKVSWSSSVAPTVLTIHTSYGMYDGGVSPIGNTVASQAPASLVKAIISGVGNTNATVTDHKALQVTPPQEQKSAFGEILTVEPTPMVQIDFPYSINTALLNVFENNSGTVTQASRMAVVSTGASSSSFARMTSKRFVKYNPGQGVECRFTAKFTTGVANSHQIAGIGNESDCLGFGYNGTAFGVFHRKNGKPEIRTLQITTKSTTAENITITLDGDADATVAVTDATATDATTTANEIAAHDYSDVGNGWSATAKGDTVEFTSWDAATHSGTFSITATTAAGTYTQRVAGTAPTESWVAQASWNGDDIFDGNGLTGVTIDPTTGNVFKIAYQWLGFGLLTFFIEDPDDGEFHLVHSIEYANANTTPSLGDPSIPLYVEALNTSNTSDISVSTASMGAYIQGKTELIGVRLSARAFLNSITTTLLPVLTVRQGSYFNSQAVRTFTKLLRMSCAVEHTKPMTIVIVENGTLTAASFSPLSSNSAIEYDTSATAISGGTELFAMPLGKAGNEILSFIDDYYSFNILPGNTLSVCAVASSGTGGEASVSLKLLERV